jgi:hypothetical protein
MIECFHVFLLIYLLDPTIINNRRDINQTVEECSLEMENTRRKNGMV